MTASASNGPASAEAVSPGVYGNVAYNPDSGDLGGIELELIGTGDEARVEYVLCEGWCNSVVKAPVRLTHDGFAFEYVEHYVDEHGQPASSMRFAVQAQRIAQGLRVTITPADHPESTFSENLEELANRYGLAVAEGG